MIFGKDGQALTPKLFFCVKTEWMFSNLTSFPVTRGKKKRWKKINRKKTKVIRSKCRRKKKGLSRRFISAHDSHLTQRQQWLGELIQLWFLSFWAETLKNAIFLKNEPHSSSRPPAYWRWIVNAFARKAVESSRKLFLIILDYPFFVWELVTHASAHVIRNNKALVDQKVLNLQHTINIALTIAMQPCL